MNPDPRDVAAVALGKAALLDKTTPRPDPHVLDAWAEVLAGAGFVITVDAALRAVTEHYTEEHRSLMPADIVARARKFCRPAPPRLELMPSRYEPDAARAERIARGVALGRAELDARRAARAQEQADLSDDDLTGDA